MSTPEEDGIERLMQEVEALYDKTIEDWILSHKTPEEWASLTDDELGDYVITKREQFHQIFSDDHPASENVEPIVIQFHPMKKAAT